MHALCRNQGKCSGTEAIERVDIVYTKNSVQPLAEMASTEKSDKIHKGIQTKDLHS